MIKKHCTLNEWPNSLTVPSGVANYHNLPFGGGAKRPKSWAKAFVSKGENKRSHHQRLFEENARKTKKVKVYIF